MDDRVDPNTEETKKPGVNLSTFVEEMLAHAEELHQTLREEGGRNDIKDRITCLKYLNEVVKTNILLKKAATDDPAAAGSAVRKYASAFTAKNATDVGKKNTRRKSTIPATIDSDFDTGDGEHIS